MLARFELFNDQPFYQNNRQDLKAVTSAILSTLISCFSSVQLNIPI